MSTPVIEAPSALSMPSSTEHAQPLAHGLEAFSMDRLEQILDASSECVTCVDRTWCFTYLNRTARTLLQTDDLIGKNLWVCYPANLKEPFHSHYRRAMDDREACAFEAFAPSIRRWVRIRAQPFEGGLILYSTDITDRKRAEEVRDASESQLKQVLDASMDAVVSFDREFNYTFVNRQGALLLGRDDLAGKNLWQEFSSTDADPYLRKTMDERVPCEFETYHPAPLDRWFRVQARPSNDGIVVFFRDVTEERAAKQILLDQQATLTFVQETAHVATWELDLATRNFRVSGGSFPVWGRPIDEMKRAEDFYSLIHPNDLAMIKERHQVVAAGEEVRPVDYRVLDMMGEVVWVEGQVILVRDAEGHPRHLRGLTMDISARKSAEALRDASAHQLEQVLAATTDSVVSVGRDWTMTFVNPQARRMLGRDDLVGKNVWDAFPASVGTQIDRYYRDTMYNGTPHDFEEYYPKPLHKWISVQSRPSAEGIVVFSRDVTENRVARERLLEQQATLAFVQQTALVATWVVDLKGGSLSVSEGSYPVYGVPNANMRTLEDFGRIVHSDDLHLVRERIQTGIATKTTIVVDFRVVDPDGSIRWLEGRGVALYNAEGVGTHLRGLTTDITARKQDEQKLRASEDRYRVLAELNPQTLWIGEADGRISYTTPGHAEYRGVEQDAILGTRWNEGFHPDDRELAMRTWMHSIATGEDYSTEARIPNQEGTFRWWSMRALPVRDEAGRILNWMGVAHDIHDMKTAGEALRRKQIETERQRAELETIYETAPLGLALFDPTEFRWLRLNESQAEIFGMPKEALLNTPLFDLVKIDGVRELFERVASGTPVLDQIVEGELPMRPGEKRMWRVNYVPVFAADGSVQAITSATLEITREKKAEAALVESEKLAAVGRLASSISHEINNPLEAITNLLYILSMDTEMHESSREFVRIAQSELSRVSQIATQTLRFHRQSVDRTRVTAADLVNSVLNLYQGRLSNSGIKVEVTYACTTPIFCYENDIRQVLNNLIANAIDAMRTGGRLVVRAHVTSQGGGTVRITIADTGHGMSAKTMARIFEPFYTTKDLNGTGLGLWISLGIVEHHAGSLRVRSCQQAGRQGTVFTLTLPI